MAGEAVGIDTERTHQTHGGLAINENYFTDFFFALLK
jgi:hypothetical protein